MASETSETSEQIARRRWHVEMEGTSAGAIELLRQEQRQQHQPEAKTAVRRAAGHGRIRWRSDETGRAMPGYRRTNKNVKSRLKASSTPSTTPWKQAHTRSHLEACSWTNTPAGRVSIAPPWIAYGIWRPKGCLRRLVWSPDRLRGGMPIKWCSWRNSRAVDVRSSLSITLRPQS